MNANAAGVFVLTGEDTLVPMQAASFASEDDFQKLLANFPALLAGEQIDSANPRRFMLVGREQPIASELGGSARWSLYHLFLDQDGVPTLVEVKRGTDTRIRREVVGQMLDYAANALAHWPQDELQQAFVSRCNLQDVDPREALCEALGSDQDWDAFWGRVKVNLQIGRVRLLFVADRIPPELRKVVEFLNAQMRPAEVLAIELRQYQGGGLRTLAPIVIGQTQGSIDQKMESNGKPRRRWDEERILDALAAGEDPESLATAKAIIAWIKTNADRVEYNDAPSYGYVAPEFDVHSGSVAPFRLWTDGNVTISYNQLKRTPNFAAPEARRTVLETLNVAYNLGVKPDGIEKQPGIALRAMRADRGARFLQTMDQVVERLKLSAEEKAA